MHTRYSYPEQQQQQQQQAEQEAVPTQTATTHGKRVHILYVDGQQQQQRCVAAVAAAAKNIYPLLRTTMTISPPHLMRKPPQQIRQHRHSQLGGERRPEGRDQSGLAGPRCGILGNLRSEDVGEAVWSVTETQTHTTWYKQQTRKIGTCRGVSEALSGGGAPA